MGFAGRIFLFLLILSPAPAQEQKSATDIEFFEKKIFPVLSERCFVCHSAKAEKLKAGLLLDSREGFLKGGDLGPSIVPGNPEKSLLIKAIRYDDEDLQMPPKKRLAPEQVADFESWVKRGAPFPVKKAGEWEALAADRWAFYPMKPVKTPAGPGNPIDAFILQKLADKKLTPAPPADRMTLIRRITFDLTGLPPTPEQIEAFVNDASPQAYEKVVDRLLKSPRYGEQWARHWLDVVRYADTGGFSNDFERPNAWRYRDYVIRSLNRDKPFDQFILEQIAGDELAPRNPEALVAVGFLRMGPWEHTGMSVAAETRQHFLDDVTHNTSATFLGLTMRCCRCHDHKFDPIPTRDYYRLQAVFAPTQFADRDAAYLAVENVSSFAELRARTERRLKEIDERLKALDTKKKAALAAYLKERGVMKVDQLPAADRPRRHFGLTDDDQTREKFDRKHREYYQLEMKRYEPFAFSVYDGPLNKYTSTRSVNKMPASTAGEMQEIRVLKGGALDSPGDPVGAGAPSAAGGGDLPAETEGRRLALAQWIADPANPLTARVIVNRVWQHHFGGRGIVATPNNFGKMGKRPTHPELLDWMAGWFTENGGSLKKLHRLILLSDTYRRSGLHPEMEAVLKLDPNNERLAVYPSRRLAAEEIRDGLLAISGELSLETGGPGVFPEINWEVALQPRHIMGAVAPAYQPSLRPEQRNRRTIYAFRTRTLADPLLEVFNRPGSDLSCERRDETTVTPQVFSLFNGQFVHDRALAMAQRLEKSTAPVDEAFRQALGRLPTAAEKRRCADHLEAMTAHHKAHPPVRVDVPKRVPREMIEELTGETVRWVEELDLMKNYQRDLKPWDVGPETRALAEVCLVLMNSNEFLYVR